MKNILDKVFFFWAKCFSSNIETRYIWYNIEISKYFFSEAKATASRILKPKIYNIGNNIETEKYNTEIFWNFKTFLFWGKCFPHIETRDCPSLGKFEQLEAAELKFNLIGGNPE